MRNFIFFVLLKLFISIKSQTTETPEYLCSVENSNVQFKFSYSSHSAWQPAANCFLLLCNNQSNSNNNSCHRARTPCFIYQAIDNTTYCAPAFTCSLLDPCNNITNNCASNTSICVINSCCTPKAICLPLSWTRLCWSETNISTNTSFWSFDNNVLDAYSNLDGIGMNSPTFQPYGITGYGAALSLDYTANQYVNIPKYWNLTHRSFTVQMWIYPTVMLNFCDFGLFSQLEALMQDRSLHFTIRGRHLYMGFHGDDTSGTTILGTHTWYHVAFVYDFSSREQRIYLNGVLEGIGTSRGPYLGESGSINIGQTNDYPICGYTFAGYIDQVYLIMRAKNSTEILNDATLITWHSFDGSFTDSGANGINGTAVDISFISGRINQALCFMSSYSYYQMTGFILLAVSNHAFSYTLWVQPRTMNGGSLLRLHSMNTYWWCLDMLGLSSNNQIVAAIWNGANQQIVGPILGTNTWTHVASTYSMSNGLRLYVNGTLIGSTGSLSYIPPASFNFVTLGYPYTGIYCSEISIVAAQFSGCLDEFRVYSRELTSVDVLALSNN